MSPELQQIRREVERVTEDQNDSSWHSAPPGKWSCAQVLEHLLLSFTGTTKGLMHVMDSGRPLGSSVTLSDRFKALVVTKLGIMPEGRSATAQTNPGDGLEPDAMRRFYDALVAMDATLADVERRFGSGVKLLDHPVLGPLSGKEWRQFHRVHAMHHLKQIVRHRRESGANSRDREFSH